MADATARSLQYEYKAVSCVYGLQVLIASHVSGHFGAKIGLQKPEITKLFCGDTFEFSFNFVDSALVEISDGKGMLLFKEESRVEPEYLNSQAQSWKDSPSFYPCLDFCTHVLTKIASLELQSCFAS